MFENLGNKLKKLRESNNLSRKQVAERVGITESSIGLYETGVRIPSLTTLVKLSAQYKVSLDYLVDNKVESVNSISTEGLTPKQIQSIKSIIDCFHN